MLFHESNEWWSTSKTPESPLSWLLLLGIHWNDSPIWKPNRIQYEITPFCYSFQSQSIVRYPDINWEKLCVHFTVNSHERKPLPSYTNCSSSSHSFLNTVASSNCLMYDQHSSEEELEVINGPNINSRVDELSESLLEIEPFKSPSSSTTSCTMTESRKRSIAQSSDDEVSAQVKLYDRKIKRFFLKCCHFNIHFRAGSQFLGEHTSAGDKFSHIATNRSTEAASWHNNVSFEYTINSQRLRSRSRKHKNLLW